MVEGFGRNPIITENISLFIQELSNVDKSSQCPILCRCLINRSYFYKI